MIIHFPLLNNSFWSHQVLGLDYMAHPPYKSQWKNCYYRNVLGIRYNVLLHVYYYCIKLSGKTAGACAVENKSAPSGQPIRELNSYKGFRPQKSFWHLLPPLYSQFLPAQDTKSHRKHTIWWINFLPQINTHGRSIQATPQRALFNSSLFHAAPYRNFVCSWNTSWYAKYVLMVDWRNKWAGCKVDKNVGKWNREQYSNPRWMSLRICICPDSDTNTSETGNFTCVSTDTLSHNQSLFIK